MPSACALAISVCRSAWRAVGRVDAVEVMDAVGAVKRAVAGNRLADGRDRHHPDIGDAQAFEARQLGCHTGEIALRRKDFGIQRVDHRRRRPEGGFGLHCV